MYAELSVVGVTILLSLTVFLLLVAEALPATSDAVPLIGESSVLICIKLFYPQGQGQLQVTATSMPF